MKPLILFTLVVAAFLALLKYPTLISHYLAAGMTYLLIISAWIVGATTTQVSHRTSWFAFGCALTLLLACSPHIPSGFIYYLAELLHPHSAGEPIYRSDEYPFFTSTSYHFAAVLYASLITYILTLTVGLRAHWPYVAVAGLTVSWSTFIQFVHKPIFDWLFDAYPDWFETIRFFYTCQFGTHLALAVVVLTVCQGLARLDFHAKDETRAMWLSSLVCGSLLVVTSSPIFDNITLPDSLKTNREAWTTSVHLAPRLSIAFGMGSLVWIAFSLFDRQPSLQSLKPKTLAEKDS